MHQSSAGVVSYRSGLQDERHLPVKAQLKVDLGTFDIKLKRVTYPQCKLIQHPVPFDWSTPKHRP
jgi:hypothetical protein